MGIVETVLNGSSIQLQKQDIKADIDTIFKKSEIIKANARKEVVCSEPLILREGNGIFYPNTINIIQGKSGTHKSRLVEVLISCILSNESYDHFLGFSYEGNNQINCILADTERNLKEQLPLAIQNIKKLTNTPIQEDLQQFEPVSLIHIKRNERFKILRILLDDLRNKTDHHLFIILDVVTDCVSNFNDPKSSLELIDLMNEYINEFDVTFLCVIHENPSSSDKARGHLGTELMNKASTVLKIGIEKEHDIIKLEFLKCRRSERFKNIYLFFSKENERLEIAEVEMVKDIEKNKQRKAPIKEVKKALLEFLSNGTKSKKEVLEKLTHHFNCGNRTIEDRLKEIENGVFENTKGEKLELSKENHGREIYMNLKKSKIINP